MTCILCFVRKDLVRHKEMTEYEKSTKRQVYTTPDLSSKKSLVSMLIEWIDNAPDVDWSIHLMRYIKVKLWIVEPIFLVVFLVSSLHILVNY